MADNADKYWMGFDLGGTKMLATLFDCDFNPVQSRRKKTKGHEGADAGMSRIADTIEKVLDDAGVKHEQLAGIGVGCPGPLDLDAGVIIEAPNLGWKNAEIRKTLEARFGCSVIISNDVDAGVYGEYRFGAARKSRCVVGVFPGTGVGGGCVYEGKILRGKNSSCMEIGHISVMPDGPRCSCGQHGCLESVSSRLAISAAAAQAAYRSQAPNLMEAAGTNLSDIRSGVLADAIDAGDTVIEKIVRQAAHHIGVAVGSVIHLLGPDTVVLGGGLVEAMEELILKEVRQTAVDFVLPSYKDTFQIVAAKLGDDSAVIGAAAWTQESIAN